jgi:hypothetical protein
VDISPAVCARDFCYSQLKRDLRIDLRASDLLALGVGLVHFGADTAKLGTEIMHEALVLLSSELLSRQVFANLVQLLSNGALVNLWRGASKLRTILRATAPCTRKQ